MAALIKSVAAADFQWCGNEGECVDRDAVIARFEGLASVIPNLTWTIKEIFVSDEDRIVVRGEATGTPTKVFLGVEPTGHSFRTMSVDLCTVVGTKIARSYHVENWTLAARQLTAGQRLTLRRYSRAERRIPDIVWKEINRPTARKTLGIS